MKFPRSSRLTSQTDFRRVFQKPCVSQDRYFKVLARRNNGQEPRLGMAVSLKVSPKAVERNRLKRVIRESFRQNHDALAEAVSMDLVVLPRREAVTICNATLTASLEAHWRRSVTKLSRQDEKGP